MNGIVAAPSLPGFRILGRLGQGGMGVVYRALDERLGREVALKFVSRGAVLDRDLRERLLREAQAASALDHPNVGTIHGIAETPNGELCIIMALYDGETLASRLHRGPLPTAEVARIGAQVASGLAAAHNRGIIHRDVKPSNIILTASGSAKLVDFGLARLERESVEQPLTQPQAVMGTAAYMSPEQASAREIDGRSDVFSLGSVLYEAACGRRAFAGRDLLSQLDAVVRREPESLNCGNSELDRVIKRAMRKEVGRRYQTAAEMAADLERIAPPTSTILPLLAPDTARSRWQWVAAGVAVALSAALAIWAFWPTQRWHWKSRPATIAFLPLVASDDPPTAALATGLAQSLAQRIAALETLNDRLTVLNTADVMSRSVGTPSEAQRFSGATLAIAGSLRRLPSGDVTVELNIHDLARKRVLSEHFHSQRGGMRTLEDRAAAFLYSYLDMRTAAQPPPSVSETAYQSYLRGLGFLNRWDKPGNLESAIAELSSVVQAQPNFAPAYTALAEASRTRFRADHDPADLQHALTYARQSATLDPEFADTHVTLGRVYQDAGQSDLAAREFQRALELSPRRWAAFAGMARTFEDAGRVQEAQSSLEKAANLNPYSWAPWNALGSFYLRHSQYREAEAAFRKGLQLTPDNPLLHSNVAVVYMRQRAWPKALAALNSSLAIAPSYSARVNLGNLHFAEARYRDAANAYEEALRMNGRDYRTWGNWAQALRLSGADSERTIPAYRKAAELAQEAVRTAAADARARSLLAIYLACLGNRHGSRMAAEDALSKPAPSADVLVDAAIAYNMLGDKPSAREAARRALAAGYDADELKNDPDLRNLDL